MNTQSKIIKLADGTRTLSVIAKQLNLPFKEVQQVVREYNLPCAAPVKLKYDFEYRKREYSICTIRKVPPIIPGGDYSPRLEEVARVSAPTAQQALISWYFQDKDLETAIRDFNAVLETPPDQERTIAIPVETKNLTLNNLVSGFGLITDTQEEAVLDCVWKIFENGDQVRFSWNEYLIDLAKIQYPREESFIKETAWTWKAIRKNHGDRLIHTLIMELSFLSPAKFWVTEKNFRWFLAHFADIPETGKSPRPIRPNVDLVLNQKLEGYLLWQGWEKVRDLLMFASCI
jgi:hypothetical protein